MSWNDVPAEILDLICSCMIQDDWRLKSLNRLSRCSLICRDICQRRIFRRVTVFMVHPDFPTDSYSSTIIQLSEVLEKNPKLATYVRELALFPRFDDFPELEESKPQPQNYAAVLHVLSVLIKLSPITDITLLPPRPMTFGYDRFAPIYPEILQLLNKLTVRSIQLLGCQDTPADLLSYCPAAEVVQMTVSSWSQERLSKAPEGIKRDMPVLKSLDVRSRCQNDLNYIFPLIPGSKITDISKLEKLTLETDQLDVGNWKILHSTFFTLIHLQALELLFHVPTIQCIADYLDLSQLVSLRRLTFKPRYRLLTPDTTALKLVVSSICRTLKTLEALPDLAALSIEVDGVHDRPLVPYLKPLSSVLEQVYSTTRRSLRDLCVAYYVCPTGRGSKLPEEQLVALRKLFLWTKETGLRFVIKGPADRYTDLK